MTELPPREGTSPVPDNRETNLPTGFTEMLEARQKAVSSLLCVGLDPDIDSIPDSLKKYIDRMFHGGAYSNNLSLKGKEAANYINSKVAEEFTRRIIDATHQSVSAFKPNMAFWEKYGEQGVGALKRVIKYARKVDSSIPIILDAKRADIGNTNRGYSDMLINTGADAITVNPYFGIEGALDPFLSLNDKGIIILVRTSNKEATRMQDLIVKDPEFGEVPYYMMVANLAERARQANPNIGIVVGATFPEQLREARKVFKGPILVPGLGKQGGMPEDLTGAFDENGRGVIAVNASGIIHASKGDDYPIKAAEAARQWKDRINTVRP